MLKEFSWKAFECTGLVEAYVFYKEMETYDKTENQRIKVEDGIQLTHNPVVFCS